MDNNKVKVGGSIGLSYPVLTKNNYTTWALKIKVYMQAQGVWTAIGPADPKVPVEEKVDKVALAMLYQGLPEDMVLSIAAKGTAKEAWTALKMMCQGADHVKKANVQILRAEFESLVMKDNKQLDDFYLKRNGLVTNIQALGDTMAESYVFKKMLRAVPIKFLQIISTLEQFGDLERLTVEEVVGSLKAHEGRLSRSGKNESSEGQLMLTEEEWQKREAGDSKLLLTREEWKKRLNKKNYDGQFSGSRPRGGRDKSNLRCYNCSAYGHFATDCRKPRRNRESREEVNMAKLEDDEPALLLAKYEREDPEGTHLNENQVIPSKLSKVQDESIVWYLDNGASSHMTGFKSKFMELDEQIRGLVSFRDGSTV
ncbi:uncharacterized protein LOC141660202 [Apium graveolens]|uniref:uncharacterized protein LOC141660202 n=1 Tax=Apium graveolens TaxID=4045 RepID=UPI003D7C0C0A